MTVESALKERACCIICKRLRLKEAPTPGHEPEKKDDQAKEPEAPKKPEKAEVPEKEEDPKAPAPAPPPPPPIPPPAGSPAPAPDLADRPAVVAAAAGAPGAAIGDPDHSEQESEEDLGFDIAGDRDELFRSGEAMAAAETRAEEAEAKAEAAATRAEEAEAKAEAAATRAEEAEAKAEAAEKRAESAEALRSVYEQKLTTVCNLYEKLKQQVAGSSGVPTASKPTASKPMAAGKNRDMSEPNDEGAKPAKSPRLAAAANLVSCYFQKRVLPAGGEYLCTRELSQKYLTLCTNPACMHNQDGTRATFHIWCYHEYYDACELTLPSQFNPSQCPKCDDPLPHTTPWV